MRLVARLAGDGPRVVGGPLMLDVAIRNEGDRDIDLGVGQQVGPMSLIHISVAHRPTPGAPPTACRKARFGDSRYTPIVDGRPSTIVVKPGREQVYPFPIRRMFDLSEAGTYSVVVVRRTSQLVGNTRVPEELRSDELTFTMVEP